MPKIVVSYRRSDSAATAGRIYDHLLNQFGAGHVFMDVDAIPFGTDFRTHIRSELLLSDILLAVIGPNWLGPTRDGWRRIDDEADPVRVEVETALRHGIAIVPVLIDGTAMPGANQLPEALKDLAFLNAAPVDMGRDFRAHMDRLARSLDRILSDPSRGGAEPPPAASRPARPVPPPQAGIPRSGARRPVMALGALALALGLGAAGWFAFGRPGPVSMAQGIGPVVAMPSPVSAPVPAPAPAIAANPAAAPPLASAPIQPVATQPSGMPDARPARTSPHGRFAWYELWTTDPAASQAFYRSVVGWDARTSGSGAGAYTMLFAGPNAVAGLAPLPAATVGQGARPNWLGYVHVGDVDASTALARDLGGTVWRAPADAPGVGRFSLVADPQGAFIVLFKSANDLPPPAAVSVPQGYTGWRELQTPNRDAALAFYGRLFGWSKASQQDLTSAGADLFAVDHQTVGGMRDKPVAAPAALWTYYFQVDGLGAATARVRAGGGTVLNPPREIAGGLWSVQALDPQGASFALVSARL